MDLRSFITESPLLEGELTLSPSVGRTINLDDLLNVIDREYLSTYVAQGGSAVRVYVGERSARELFTSNFRKLAVKNGFIYAHVDARTTRINFSHYLFAAVARQIPWNHLTKTFLAKCLRGGGLSVASLDHLSYTELAKSNNIDMEQLQIIVDKAVFQMIQNDFRLPSDFRAAISILCRAALLCDENSKPLARLVEQWMFGELKAISDLRSLRITKRISHVSGRQMLVATGAWLRLAGYSGLAITSDYARVAIWKKDPTAFSYSRNAALQAYESLRQFIDSADAMSGIFLAVITSNEFLFDRQRGMESYEALRARLIDDVRDRHRVNPLAPMVRLALG